MLEYKMCLGIDVIKYVGNMLESCTEFVIIVIFICDQK